MDGYVGCRGGRVEYGKSRDRFDNDKVIKQKEETKRLKMKEMEKKTMMMKMEKNKKIKMKYR